MAAVLRIPVIAPECLIPDDETPKIEVLDEVREKLGYKGPDFAAPPLLGALRAIDCGILSDEGVEGYKHKAVARSRKGCERVRREMLLLERRGMDAYHPLEEVVFRLARNPNLNRKPFTDDQRRLLRRAGEYLSAVVVAVGGMAVWWLTGSLAGFVVTPLLMLCAWAHSKYSLARHRSEAWRGKRRAALRKKAAAHPELRWDVTRLDQYRGAVPQGVQLLALEIHEACPDAQFFVEHTEVARMADVEAELAEIRRRELRRQEELEEARRRYLRRQDPFLLVQLGSERYRVAVWDEEGTFKVCKA